MTAFGQERSFGDVPRRWHWAQQRGCARVRVTGGRHAGRVGSNLRPCGPPAWS